eukprot:gene4216-5991_t
MSTLMKSLAKSFPWSRNKSNSSTNNINKKVPKIRLGICAMDKKAKSKPMKEILKRLSEEMFEIVYFGDDCIMNTPIEAWPVVEALIAFYSTKFPTEKAMEYVKLRKPYMINDLGMQSVLNDRREVYNLLEKIEIDVPSHIFVERDGAEPFKEEELEEYDEYIVVKGVQINKPLVEKPVDAEDHNIYIYYPMSAGGGSKRLFRKVDDRSSEFYPHFNDLRREGSFIYEEFLITQGTDVKVYTVGPEYGHAEARKSPVVDGRVKRDSLGLEVRYPVILTPTEKDMVRKVVNAFGQRVCGFDILRVHGSSYCCDVNGFSFVKNSRKYYDDASQILAEIMFNALRPEFNVASYPKPPPLPPAAANTSPTLSRKNSKLTNLSSAEIAALENQNSEAEVRSLSPSISNQSMESAYGSKDQHQELRCVIAVLRHGDRTPKQKMKIKVSHPKYLEYFHSYVKTPRKDLKVKSKAGLVRFLETTTDIIAELPVDSDLSRKLKQIRDVLERWEISGINRKLQMKPQKWAEEETSQEDLTGSVSGSTTDWSPATELILILKWGGDLTPLGREQAECLGAQFRHNMYPDVEGKGGVLRLHATYRHDLKIKASDEGRVMKTAAAFTKGLLELEGQLTPIIASLVTIEEKNRLMLDRGGNYEVKAEMDRCKDHLNLLQTDQNVDEDLVQLIGPDCSNAMKSALLNLGNPLKSLERMHVLISELCVQLKGLCEEYEGSLEDANELAVPYSMSEKVLSGVNSSNNLEQPQFSTNPSPVVQHDSSSPHFFPPPTGTPPLSSSSNLNDEISSNVGSYMNGYGDSEEQFVGLYLFETFSLMLDRWEKLNKDFFNKNSNTYDLTKVPDVYDMIRYDILHNSRLQLSGMEELFKLATSFENCVVPQEYGIDQFDKRYIGAKMCGALIEKIKFDLKFIQSAHNVSDKNTDLQYKLDHSHAEDLSINSLNRIVRTRLYFTSESHLHTLLNVLRYPHGDGKLVVSPEGLDQLNRISELSYLTQIVIRLFEVFDEDKSAEPSFRCEISLSPGATNDPINDKGSTLAPYIILNQSIDCEELLKCLDDAIDLSKTAKEDAPISTANTSIENFSTIMAAIDATPDKNRLSQSKSAATSPDMANNLNESFNQKGGNLAKDDNDLNLSYGTKERSPPCHANSIISTKSMRIRRSESITVVANSESSDTWERPEKPFSSSMYNLKHLSGNASNNAMIGRKSHDHGYPHRSIYTEGNNRSSYTEGNNRKVGSHYIPKPTSSTGTTLAVLSSPKKNNNNAGKQFEKQSSPSITTAIRSNGPSPVSTDTKDDNIIPSGGLLSNGIADSSMQRGVAEEELNKSEDLTDLVVQDTTDSSHMPV